ncbi:MAG: hypothetical protein EPN72_07525 [Nevskiaceae bacterium]|nr:MAG: hypothetical protein EPN63_05085 [Nevskiaceae bacterium]TBR73013.1 MAG: hypothetical protein EPN72_07525 [Nevskiaceae bacterium]
MNLRTTPRTPSAYDYQLTIKQLLRSSLAQHADQEIVYRGTQRFTYRGKCTRRAKTALSELGHPTPIAPAAASSLLLAD